MFLAEETSRQRKYWFCPVVTRNLMQAYSEKEQVEKKEKENLQLTEWGVPQEI